MYCSKCENKMTIRGGAIIDPSGDGLSIDAGVSPCCLAPLVGELPEDIQIPLLTRLCLWFTCDDCQMPVYLHKGFYEDIKEVGDDGRLLCEDCRVGLTEC